MLQGWLWCLLLDHHDLIELLSCSTMQLVHRMDAVPFVSKWFETCKSRSVKVMVKELGLEVRNACSCPAVAFAAVMLVCCPA